jgi:hypothetical protein
VRGMGDRSPIKDTLVERMFREFRQQLDFLQRKWRTRKKQARWDPLDPMKREPPRSYRQWRD